MAGEVYSKPKESAVSTKCKHGVKAEYPRVIWCIFGVPRWKVGCVFPYLAAKALVISIIRAPRVLDLLLQNILILF